MDESVQKTHMVQMNTTDVILLSVIVFGLTIIMFLGWKIIRELRDWSDTDSEDNNR